MFEPHPIPHRSRRAQPFAAALAAALVSAAVTGTTLAQSSDEEPLEPIISNDISPDGANKQCEWACEQWQKICNIDPRGIYKCNRICARFGEVCDE